MLLISAVLALVAQDTVRLSFPEAVDHARNTNPGFVRDRLQYDNSVVSLSQSKADRYYPEMRFELTTPEYISEIQRREVDNRDVFVPIERRTVEARLNITQPLPTGGSLGISGRVTALNQPQADDPLERSLGATSLRFTVSQQIFGINQSIRAYRLARESFARAGAEFANEERNLSRSVMEAYYGLVQAKKQVQIDSVMFVRDSIRNATALTTTQQATNEVDSLKFELEAARSAFNRTRSAQTLNRARTRLNEVLALPPEVVVVPDTAIAVAKFIPDVAAGLAAATANRQDLRLAQLGVENRKAGLRDAHRTSPITLRINTAIGFSGSSNDERAEEALRGAFADQPRSGSATLVVSIPVFDRFDERYAVIRARNDLESAEINLADQTRRIEGEVRVAAQRIENASMQLDLAERQFDLTVRTLAIQTRRFAAGEVNSVEFLIDQASARQAEIGLLSAQVEMLTATEEWRRAIGEQSRPAPTR